jgi:hypothetical protein
MPIAKMMKVHMVMKKMKKMKVRSMKGNSSEATQTQIKDRNSNAVRKDARKLHKRFGKALKKLDKDDEALMVYDKLPGKGKQEFMVCRPYTQIYGCDRSLFHIIYMP